MARLVGVSIPDEKKIKISLTYIFGVGPKIATEILETSKVDPEKRTKDLTEQELTDLQQALSKVKIEGDLRREVSMNVRRLQEIGTYRGKRHRVGLPSRGQRTQCNARTRRGGKKTVANKKKVAK